MKVYVSKESKKEETKSTAYSFLLVSVFGFIALILFATGVLPVHVADYMKIMLCIVMGVMLLIFFVIGIVSLRQLKTLGTQAEKENDLSFPGLLPLTAQKILMRAWTRKFLIRIFTLNAMRS